MQIVFVVSGWIELLRHIRRVTGNDVLDVGVDRRISDHLHLPVTGHLDVLKNRFFALQFLLLQLLLLLLQLLLWWMLCLRLRLRLLCLLLLLNRLLVLLWLLGLFLLVVQSVVTRCGKLESVVDSIK